MNRARTGERPAAPGDAAKALSLAQRAGRSEMRAQNADTFGSTRLWASRRSGESATA
jgi:hypothetical protein